MAIPDKKLVNFKELKALVANEGFLEKNSFSTSAELCTVADVLNLLHIAVSTGLEINNVPGNKLCRREIIIKRPTEWIGTDPSCLQDIAPPPDSNLIPPVLTIDTAATTDTSIKLDWTAATDDVGLDSYYIYIYWLDLTFGWRELHFPIDVNLVLTYIVQNLTPNTSYKFKIKVINTLYNEAFSNEKTENTEEEAGEDNPPSAPVISIGVTSDTIINVNWTESIDDYGILNYKARLEMYLTGVVTGWDWVDSVEHPNDEFSHQWSGLIPGQLYRVSVVAWDTGANYAVSNSIEHTMSVITGVNPPTLAYFTYDGSVSTATLRLNYHDGSADAGVSHYECYTNITGEWAYYASQAVGTEYFKFKDQWMDEFQFIIYTVDNNNRRAGTSPNSYPTIYYTDHLPGNPCASTNVYLDGKNNKDDTTHYSSYYWSTGATTERIRIAVVRSKVYTLWRTADGIEEEKDATIMAAGNC